MQLTTQDPQTGTKVRIEADRGFDNQGDGDSVLRILGLREDGSQTFDAEYVEVDPREADGIARLLRHVRQPTQELQDRVAQEIQAMYSARLSARDAQQIAQVTVQATQRQISQWMGYSSPEQASKKIERLAERFERAAAQRSQSPTSRDQPEGSGKASRN